MKTFIMLMALAGLVTSCGGNKADQKAASDTIPEEVEMVEVESEEISSVQEEPQETAVEEEKNEDDGTYQPPFRIYATYEHRSGGWMERTKYTYDILTNGRLSGTYKYERQPAEINSSEWETLGEEEFGGKWSTSSITMGDGYLKVYALDPSNREGTEYLPATCDYIWMCDGAWFECENWNTQKAIKVEKVEKL